MRRRASVHEVGEQNGCSATQLTREVLERNIAVGGHPAYLDAYERALGGLATVWSGPARAPPRAAPSAAT
jgi:hypothetical protein